MEPKENLPSDEEPLKPFSDGNNNEKVDRIVNELRSLLSNKSTPPVEKPEVEKPSPKNPDDDLASSIFTDPFDTSSFPPTFPGGIPPANHKPIDPSLEDPLPHAPGSSLPSDADFWKGNVLGWGDKDEPVSVGDESIHLPPGPAPIKIEPAPKGTNPYDIPGLESDEADTENTAKDPKKVKSISIDIGLDYPPTEPATPPSPKSVAANKNPEASVEAPTEGALLQMFPIPPEAPGFEDDKQNSSTVSEKNISDEKLSQDEASLLKVPPSETPLPKKLSDEQKNHIDTSEDFYGEESQVKPDQLIQVACIVPSGEELKAQAFYRMLRESAAKSSRQFDIQPVFIHDWEPNRIDMVAWEKSASLSGADILFVVVHKSDAETFKPLMKKSSEPNLEKRLIYVEHIPLKNLYSDLLIQLMEKPKWRKQI